MSLAPEDVRRFGSSDAAAMLRLDPYRSPLDVYLRWMHGTEQPDEPWMAAGREAEATVIARFGRRRGLSMVTGLPVLRCEINGVPIRAQCDSEAAGDGGVLIGEAKAPTQFVHPWEWSEALPPIHWRAQVIHQMGVRWFMGYSVIGAFIVAEWGYHEGQRREWFVPWDDAARTEWAYLLSVYKTAHVEWTEPDDDGKTYPPEPRDPKEAARLALAVYPREIDALEEATSDEITLMRDGIALRDTASACEAAWKAQQDRLRAAIGKRAGIRSGGLKATWKANAKGSRVLLLTGKGE